MKIDTDNKARLGFALVLLIGGVAGILWYLLSAAQYATYEIETGDAVSGLNETAAVGGDVIASETGAGNAAGGAGTGGAASANGGTATSGPAAVANTATVSQTSTQNMNAWDNDNWVSIWAFKKKHSW